MMASDFDFVIRGGLIVDGTGGKPFRGDVGIAGDRIAAVGDLRGDATEVIDARDRIVTPGFVDVHTHYDGQITWENTLSPSSGHGVTTVVMGNCGVGFAPIRHGQRELAIKLMEGVEDIPEVVMTEGLPWNWESFPEYLDALEARHADADFAAQLPHSPLRVYVMGEDGANMVPPTQAHLDEMRRLTAQAITAGALGVSSSRSLAHRFRDGRLAPSVKTEEDEIMALADGLRDAGAGVFQLLPNLSNPATDEFALIERLHARSGRPISFTLNQDTRFSGGWRHYLDGVGRASAAGRPIRGQIFPRPTGVMLGLDLSLHPFALNPSYRPIADLPLAEKVAAMKEPAFRARILAEEPTDPNPFLVALAKMWDPCFPLGDPPCYTPALEESIPNRARRAGREPLDLLYDELLQDDGHAMIYVPVGNTADGRLDSASLLAGMPGTLLGLGDGGAHYGMICDGSWPSYFLQSSVRDAPEDRKVALPLAVKMMSRDAAEAVGLRDRGLVRAGYKADLNVIDFDRLRLHAPHVRRDLPANGRRIHQQADGYAVTLVSGRIVRRDGVATDQLPGRLVRGGKTDPGIAIPRPS
jgi:N-acyl-D-aspartate/D-glutamate deacylase